MIFLVIAFVAGCDDRGQNYFTGTIDYAYSYASDSLNADSLARTRPSKSVLRYDVLNYQSKFITPDTITNYHSGSRNKCLTQTGHSENFTCEDYGSFTDSVLFDTDEKIPGDSCKILEIQKKNSWLQYYVSSGLRLAPANYRSHRSYNWDFYGEKANGALILKSEHRFNYFTMKGIATAINKIDDAFTPLEIGEKLFSQLCK